VRAALRSTRTWLIFLFCLALVVRLGFFALDPNPYLYAGLSADHGELARNIVSNGEWFVANRSDDVPTPEAQLERRSLVDPSGLDYSEADRRPEYRPVILEPPGQGVLLAGLWTVTGDQDYGYLQILQILLDAATVFLVFDIAMRLYGRRLAALVAAGLYAVFLPIAHLVTIPHLDAWGGIFTIVITLLFVRGMRASGRPGWWLAALGVAVGLGAYFRPGLLLVPLALAAAAIPSVGWRRSITAAAVPLLLAAFLIAPWTIRNYNEFDRFIPLRTGIGQNLWEGLGEVENDFGAKLSDSATEAQVKRVRPDLEYGTPAYDDFLRDWATEAIREHPGTYARVLAQRTVDSTILLRNDAWVGATPPRSGNPVSYALDNPWAALKLAISALGEPLLFLLALAAAIWTRERWREHVLLLAVPLATVLPYIVLHFEPRYALPGSFAYMILVGVGVSFLLEARRSGRRRATAA
jgi:4-amino-4-deoxy-L-arabinose transferase-like glycosyltransferase